MQNKEKTIHTCKGRVKKKNSNFGGISRRGLSPLGEIYLIFFQMKVGEFDCVQFVSL